MSRNVYNYNFNHDLPPNRCSHARLTTIKFHHPKLKLINSDLRSHTVMSVPSHKGFFATNLHISIMSKFNHCSVIWIADVCDETAYKSCTTHDTKWMHLGDSQSRLPSTCDTTTHAKPPHRKQIRFTARTMTGL